MTAILFLAQTSLSKRLSTFEEAPQGTKSSGFTVKRLKKAKWAKYTTSGWKKSAAESCPVMSCSQSYDNGGPQEWYDTQTKIVEKYQLKGVWHTTVRDDKDLLYSFGCNYGEGMNHGALTPRRTWLCVKLTDDVVKSDGKPSCNCLTLNGCRQRHMKSTIFAFIKRRFHTTWKSYPKEQDCYLAI
eukprot:CAMPEP_0172724124 /NCGR_PEP_ID=MMETSP1074-20121228/85202_1 /TAXON_ID=2916 /ORGANISM="Ceratium fusus, Strain PA161109" /LENGTH=184 /DNA_ID=CAMNT_0013550493 /DNA_START=40 /DNA_END=594 /DNA_ORIENTATION=+